MADFEASRVKQKQRTCDSSHAEFRLRFEGSQTSTDPRLTGDLVAKVRSVVNTQTGLSASSELPASSTDPAPLD